MTWTENQNGRPSGGPMEEHGSATPRKGSIRSPKTRTGRFGKGWSNLWNAKMYKIYRDSFDHDYGQGGKSKAEGRTLAVMILTLLTMGMEISTGLFSHSMALLADGIHMGGHALALGLTFLGYYFTRKYAGDKRFTFGSGKITELIAFTSAILLMVSTLFIAYESVARLMNPKKIEAGTALLVAVVGLVVNLLSAWILGGGLEKIEGKLKSDRNGKNAKADGGAQGASTADGEAEPSHYDVHYGIKDPDKGVESFEEHSHVHSHMHAHLKKEYSPDGEAPNHDNHIDPSMIKKGEEDKYIVHSHVHAHAHAHEVGSHGLLEDEETDNNLKGAILHVLSDAATSVAAILGLMAAGMWRIYWFDALIALFASFLIAKWSISLMKETGGMLLDADRNIELENTVRDILSREPGTEVVDLHIWPVGQGAWTMTAALWHEGDLTPMDFKRKLEKVEGLYHPIIEVQKKEKAP